MTEREVLEAIWSATITPDEWVRRIRTNPTYNWKNTKYGKALLAARAMGLPSPGPGPTPTPTPPPSGALVQQIQNIIYCAQNPETALSGRRPFKPALTADPGYASFNTPSVVAQLKAHFGTCGAWFVQTQVSVNHARQFVAQLGLDFLIFQGETSEEYHTAIELGASLMVGNANAWTPQQRDDATRRCQAGTLAFAQETYTNLGGPWPENSSAGGVPAASFVLGVYDGTNEQAGRGWYPTVQAYKDHTPPGAWPSVSVYHAAGLRPEDWRALA